MPRKAKQAAAAIPTQASQVEVPEQSNREAIAVAAYFRAQARGFAPGQEMDDWLAAEQEFAPPPQAN